MIDSDIMIASTPTLLWDHAAASDHKDGHCGIIAVLFIRCRNIADFCGIIADMCIATYNEDTAPPVTAYGTTWDQH
jgi:hypothetical protein